MIPSWTVIKFATTISYLHVSLNFKANEWAKYIYLNADRKLATHISPID